MLSYIDSIQNHLISQFMQEEDAEEHSIKACCYLFKPKMRRNCPQYLFSSWFQSQNLYSLSLLSNLINSTFFVSHFIYNIASQIHFKPTQLGEINQMHFYEMYLPVILQESVEQVYLVLSPLREALKYNCFASFS